MLHVAVPEHAPLQPPNTSLVSGVSVRVTLVLPGNVAEHVPGHVIPAGELVTLPNPVTETLSVSPALKFALTLSAALMVTLHAAVPEQLPPQPEKNEFEPGASDNVTCAP